MTHQVQFKQTETGSFIQITASDGKLVYCNGKKADRNIKRYESAIKKGTDKSFISLAISNGFSS